MGTNCCTSCAGVLLLLLSCSSARTVGERETCGLPPADGKLAQALALYAQGLYYVQDESSSRDTAKAADAFRRAIALDPLSVETREALIQCLLVSGDLDGALSEQLNLARARRDNPQIWLETAFLAMRLKSKDVFAECITVLPTLSIDKLSKKTESGSHLVSRLAVIGWAAVQDDDQSLAAFKKYIAFAKPQDIFQIVGDVAGRLAESPKKQAQIWRFIEVMADVPRDKRTESVFFLRLAERLSKGSHADGELVSALRMKALEAMPLNFKIVPLIVFPFKESVRVTDFSAVAERVAKYPHPEHLDFAFSMMRLQLFIFSSDKAAAASEFKKIQALHNARQDSESVPDEYYLYGSVVLDEAGRSEESLALLENGLKHNPRSDEIKNSIAYTLALQGCDLDRALDLIDSALRNEPENYAYLDTLGWVLYKRGDFDGALRSLSQALDFCNETSHELYDHVGDVLQKLGRASESAAWWAKSYSIKKDTVVADKLRQAGVDPARIP